MQDDGSTLDDMLGDDTPCVTYAETDDAFAYRRQLADSGLFSRSRSCDDYPNKEVAWVNVEVWDITGCCDVKTSCDNPPCRPEGHNMVFFILMILFWCVGVHHLLIHQFRLWDMGQG